jgi:hypothetical protein
MNKMSAGYYGIMLALNLCGKVDLYGFGGTAKKETPHYFPKPSAAWAGLPLPGVPGCYSRVSAWLHGTCAWLHGTYLMSLSGVLDCEITWWKVPPLRLGPHGVGAAAPLGVRALLRGEVQGRCRARARGEDLIAVTTTRMNHRLRRKYLACLFARHRLRVVCFYIGCFLISSRHRPRHHPRSSHRFITCRASRMKVDTTQAQAQA